MMKKKKSLNKNNLMRKNRKKNLILLNKRRNKEKEKESPQRMALNQFKKQSKFQSQTKTKRRQTRATVSPRIKIKRRVIPNKPKNNRKSKFRPQNIKNSDIYLLYVQNSAKMKKSLYYLCNRKQL